MAPRKPANRRTNKVTEGQDQSLSRFGKEAAEPVDPKAFVTHFKEQVHLVKLFTGIGVVIGLALIVFGAILAGKDHPIGDTTLKLGEFSLATTQLGVLCIVLGVLVVLFTLGKAFGALPHLPGRKT